MSKDNALKCSEQWQIKFYMVFTKKNYTTVLIFSSPLMHFSFKSPPKLMLQQILDFEYDANGSFCVNMLS